MLATDLVARRAYYASVLVFQPIPEAVETLASDTESHGRYSFWFGALCGSLSTFILMILI